MVTLDSIYILENSSYEAQQTNSLGVIINAGAWNRRKCMVEKQF